MPEYLTDYGLKDTGDGRFEALDGTTVVIRAQEDPSLPPGMGTSSMLRETVYGVADVAALDAIEAELRRDREVTRRAGVVRAADDKGFALAFQVTVRRSIALPAETVSATGAAPQRGPNQLGLPPEIAALKRSLSHVVYFVPDAARAEAFYARLGFVCTDRLTGAGPFLHPADAGPPHLVPDPDAAVHEGLRALHPSTWAGRPKCCWPVIVFCREGLPKFLGPGRHKVGSNWFWYFNSPLGCHIEYEADMDLHDDSWTPRALPANEENSQLFLFQRRDKWFPSGPPPDGAS